MKRVRLSNDFYLDEFTKSATARGLNISNEPDAGQKASLVLLVLLVLQPVRDRWGAINILSGFRSAVVNANLKRAAEKSQHMAGEAADIICSRMKEVFWWIVDNLEFDQIIWEYGCDNTPDWIHISFKRGANRNQVLRAYKENSKTVYRKFER